MLFHKHFFLLSFFLQLDQSIQQRFQTHEQHGLGKTLVQDFKNSMHRINNCKIVGKKFPLLSHVSKVQYVDQLAISNFYFFVFHVSI